MTTFAKLLGPMSLSRSAHAPQLITVPAGRRGAKPASTAATASGTGRSKAGSPAPDVPDFSHLRTGAEIRQATGGIEQQAASPDADYRARRAVALLEGRDPDQVTRSRPAASNPLPLPPEAQLAAVGLNAKRILASFAMTKGGRR